MNRKKNKNVPNERLNKISGGLLMRDKTTGMIYGLLDGAPGARNPNQINYGSFDNTDDSLDFEVLANRQVTANDLARRAELRSKENEENKKKDK